jgi:L-serine deaminase
MGVTPEMSAHACAIALAGIKSVIPADEVIMAMKSVGNLRAESVTHIFFCCII